MAGIIVCAIFAAGCRSGVEDSNKYKDNSLWLCKPGLAHDYCYDDLTATEILPDTSRVLRTHEPETKTKVDCFYIYPTVDLTGNIGNHTDFSDVTPMLFPIMNQAAWFNQICTVYAPLYRQVTFATLPNPQADKYKEIAYEDVREAFQYYLKHHNAGRPFIIMGHSQGSMMLRMLIQREIENNEALLSRMVVALLIGGDVRVPQGDIAGDTFQKIPLCTSEDETGCVIAYRSYGEGFTPTGGLLSNPPEGMDIACTNPADLTGQKHTLDAVYFPNEFDFAGVTGTLMTDVTTPFLLYRNLYTAKCAKDDNGISFLEIGTEQGPGDIREIPMTQDDLGIAASLGLHIVDYNLGMGDLLRLVEKKSKAFMGQ